MSSDLAIRVSDVSKCYQIYDEPHDRLKQMFLPRLRDGIGLDRNEYYREFWALRGINFEMRKGESVGILGRNGSGKSTLLQIITGTLAPTTGAVETDGRIVALLELGSGFNPEFSGRENVFLGGALQGFTARQMEERFDDIAAFADIGSFMELPVKTYSSGMYARLAFAAAIHNTPDILIVDEILAVGDSAFQNKCIKRIYGMMNDGVSVLLVSHDAYQVRSICQKALFLQNGNQRFFGTAARGMDEYIGSFATNGNDDDLSALPEATVETVAQNDSVSTDAFQIAISNVEMLAHGSPTDSIFSGDSVAMEFDYEIFGNYDGELSFVVNLYREDDVYIFGTTTRMTGLKAFTPKARQRVRVDFPALNLVSGRYKWRVAVNDGGGLQIFTEAVPVCAFEVNDDFRAVGLVDIPHQWSTLD